MNSVKSMISDEANRKCILFDWKKCNLIKGTCKLQLTFSFKFALWIDQNSQVKLVCSTHIPQFPTKVWNLNNHLFSFLKSSKLYCSHQYYKSWRQKTRILNSVFWTFHNTACKSKQFTLHFKKDLKMYNNSIW